MEQSLGRSLQVMLKPALHANVCMTILLGGFSYFSGGSGGSGERVDDGVHNLWGGLLAVGHGPNSLVPEGGSWFGEGVGEAGGVRLAVYQGRVGQCGLWPWVGMYQHQIAV